jgi:hypothetical protein
MIVKFEASDLDSSNIDSLEYVYTTDKREWRMKQEGSLLVTFSGGQRYVYEDVAFMKVMAVIADESVGTAFNDLIKSSHSYTKYS